eukprot:2852265-Karenia_brevis.AAC.1
MVTKQAGLQNFTVTIAGSDTTEKTKTGAQDDTIAVSRWRQWLGPLLKKRAEGLSEQALLLGLTNLELRQQWNH